MSEHQQSSVSNDFDDQVSKEAEREGEIQDILVLVESLMAEDAEKNEEQARKTLLKAHRLANEARHWGDIAKRWFHYFLDTERTEACFRKAVEFASADRVPTVEYRIKEVDHEGNVVRHVIGHRMVPAGVYLHCLLAATSCLKNETKEQLRLMRRAEKDAENIRSSLRAFDEFDEDSLRFFDKAESQLCWLHIAKCWWEDFEERQQAHRCLAKAESIAAELSGVLSWVSVAKVWMRVMGEPGESRRCIAEAERTIEEETFHDYVELAEGVAALGDPELPVQYLDKAESLIEELSDWSAIQYTWEELGYFDRAERAEKIWEYLASKVSEEEYLENGGYGYYNPAEGPY